MSPWDLVRYLWEPAELNQPDERGQAPQNVSNPVENQPRLGDPFQRQSDPAGNALGQMQGSSMQWPWSAVNAPDFYPSTTSVPAPAPAAAVPYQFFAEQQNEVENNRLEMNAWIDERNRVIRERRQATEVAARLLQEQQINQDTLDWGAVPTQHAGPPRVPPILSRYPPPAHPFVDRGNISLIPGTTRQAEVNGERDHQSVGQEMVDGTRRDTLYRNSQLESAGVPLPFASSIPVGSPEASPIQLPIICVPRRDTLYRNSQLESAGVPLPPDTSSIPVGSPEGSPIQRPIVCLRRPATSSIGPPT